MSVQEQINTWVTPGVLGFYQSCEMTVCGLLDHSGNVHNLFTHIVFETREQAECPPRAYLTQRNERFGDGVRLLVEQSHISVANAALLCNQLEPNCKELELESGSLMLSGLTPIPAVFVPRDSTLSIPLNRLLKNSYCGGSMVAEWFGDAGDIHKLLSEKELRRAALRIRELLPIDLFTLSDRIGNIIFQFPSQVAFCELSGSEHSTEITAHFDDRVQNINQYILSIMTDHDHTLVGYRIGQPQQRDLVATVETTGGPYVITLTDIRHGIPVLHQTTSMMRMFDGILTVKGNEDSVRTITLQDQQEDRIKINSSERISAGRPEHPWKAAATQRRYQKRMDELMRSQEFIRYGKGSNVGDRQRALNDLRALMNVGPDTRVCLWDPYLSAEDLLETWYYTDAFGLELRAITSNEIPKKMNMTFECWRDKQREILRSGSNQFGINLLWRAQHDMFGFSFHDRFLIQLPPDEEPRVWSLGISVNGLGKSHHILQLVSNPGYIVDAFEELWNALDDPSCQIWDSKEEFNHG